MNARATYHFGKGEENGSGKSTIRNLIIDYLGLEINIDPDAIARRIDPQHPEAHRVSAGKEVIRSVRTFINGVIVYEKLCCRSGQRILKNA